MCCVMKKVKKENFVLLLTEGKPIIKRTKMCYTWIDYAT